MKTIGLISANYSSEKFGALTASRPLASIPYAGRYRLMDFVLSNMVNSGITKVGIITPYNTGSVIDHVGAGKPWSLNRKKDGLFMMPGSIYGIHTEGCRFLFRDIIDNKAFFLKSDADYVIISASSDIYNMDYNGLIKAHAESGNQITILYRKYLENEVPKGGYFPDINNDGTVKNIYNSAAQGETNYFMDCFVIDRLFLIDFINWYSQLEYKDIFEIIKDNISKFSVGSYEFDGYLGKINDVSDYLKVCKDITDYNIRNEIFNADRCIYTKVQDDSPVLYEGNGTALNSIIGAGCRISGEVVNSNIFRSVNIEKDAVVRNSVVMMYSNIGEGAVLENVICDKSVRISSGATIIGSPENPIIISKGDVI